jgi:hypothetical protein
MFDYLYLAIGDLNGFYQIMHTDVYELIHIVLNFLKFYIIRWHVITEWK